MIELNNININKDQIIKFLGYGNKTPSKKVLSIIDDEISNGKKYLKPSFYSKVLKIDNIDNDKINLINGTSLYGKSLSDKLKNCSYISVNLATIGDDISPLINNYMSNKETMKALILDKVSVVALDYIVTMNQKKLSEEVNLNGDNIISKVSTGDPDFPIENQKYIFDILKDINKEISLNDFYMMTPIKSTAFILGIGKGEPLKCNNCCSTCPTPCNFK